ncbi:MAG: imidazole glycerol phosphate synthase subunit HisH [Verrucomicrobia bacterium]|nr:imidazole glycerol phosphate synthase subunit HisH [Verrucomicrobiota bacterium]
MIALLDYGSGNLRSVEKALTKSGAKVRRVTTPHEMIDASAAVLPGVGAFDDCLSAMKKQDLATACLDFIKTGKPFLGICVGYQALFERSEEFNSCALGLSLFEGKVVRFPNTPGLKVPQIGWNQIRVTQPNCPIYKGIPDGSYVYFVHSYFPQPRDLSVIATHTNYGGDFASSVWKDNVFATQFHPEKSQETGLRLLSNFVKLAS